MHSILQEPEINKYIQKLYRGKCLYATRDTITLCLTTEMFEHGFWDVYTRALYNM